VRWKVKVICASHGRLRIFLKTSPPNCCLGAPPALDRRKARHFVTRTSLISVRRQIHCVNVSTNTGVFDRFPLQRRPHADLSTSCVPQGMICTGSTICSTVQPNIACDLGAAERFRKIARCHDHKLRASGLGQLAAPLHQALLRIRLHRVVGRIGRLQEQVAHIGLGPEVARIAPPREVGRIVRHQVMAHIGSHREVVGRRRSHRAG
jgi:hypothetical protein